MAFWNSSTILPINEGVTANDGTGDSIRDAFLKVEDNFSNVSNYLSQTSLDFLNANVSYNLTTNYASISNLLVANTWGTTSSITGNVTVGNLIANSGIYSTGVTNLSGNTYVGNVIATGTIYTSANIVTSGAILPSANLTYDLGAPGQFFRNLYVGTLYQTNTVTTSSDAGLLLLHANLTPGDVKDVGVFGKYYAASSNSYAFFGTQYATKNLVYKITPTDWTLTTSVVADGVYGNVQFGSQLLSNTTAATSKTTGALIVAGGVGVAGNIHAVTFNGNISSTVANISSLTVSRTVEGNLSVNGNLFAYGGQVLTTTSSGIGSLYAGGAVFTVPISTSDITTSTSILTGALRIAGGAGIVGNLNAGAVYGPLYGTIQSSYAAQPNITSLGTLTGLTVNGAINVSGGTLQTAALSVTSSLVVSGTTTLSGTLSGLTAITTGTVNAATIGNTGATLTGTLSTAAQPNITSVGTLTSLAVTGNVSAGNVTVGNIVATGNISSSYLLGNGGSLTGLVNNSAIINLTSNVTAANSAIVTANSAVVSYVNTLNTAMAANVTAANSAIVTANSAVVSYVNTLNTAMAANITTANTGMKSYVDSVTTAWTANAVTQDTAIAGLRANITAANTNIVASSYTNSNVAAYLPTYTGNITGGNITLTGSLLLSANNSSNIGSPTAWFNNVHAITFRGTSVSAQYADLAELYKSDEVYEPGTVVIFGGTEEITVTRDLADERVAGVISTNPAYLMNSAQPGLPVALRGRVPVRVIGPVAQGDSLVTSSVAGYAVSIGRDRSYGQSVFAKALVTNKDIGTKVIEAVIL